MSSDVTGRLAEVTPELLRLAKGGCRPGASLEEILAAAECLRDRDKPRDQEATFIQLWFSQQDVRLIRDALLHYGKALSTDRQRVLFLRDTFVGWLQGYNVQATPGMDEQQTKGDS